MRAAEAASAGRTEDAIAHLSRAIGLFPDARSALYLRARLLAASGKTLEAEEDVQKINETQPNADTLLLQAQLWISEKRYDDARELVREARRLDPHHGGTWVVEGDLSIVAGQIDAARASTPPAQPISAHCRSIQPASVAKHAHALIAYLDAARRVRSVSRPTRCFTVYPQTRRYGKACDRTQASRHADESENRDAVDVDYCSSANCFAANANNRGLRRLKDSRRFNAESESPNRTNATASANRTRS